MYPDAFLNHAHLSVDNSRISPDVTLLSVGAHLARTSSALPPGLDRGANRLDLSSSPTPLGAHRLSFHRQLVKNNSLCSLATNYDYIYIGLHIATHAKVILKLRAAYRLVLFHITCMFAYVHTHARGTAVIRQRNTHTHSFW